MSWGFCCLASSSPASATPLPPLTLATRSLLEDELGMIRPGRDGAALAVRDRLSAFAAGSAFNLAISASSRETRTSPQTTTPTTSAAHTMTIVPVFIMLSATTLSLVVPPLFARGLYPLVTTEDP